MEMRHAIAVSGIAAALAAMACGTTPTGPPESVLVPIVQADGIPFDGQAIPDHVLDRLGQSRVVIVGETHHLAEHRQWMAALVRGLHARGYRELLMELPHMVDWLLVDFVLDRNPVTNWELPEDLGGELLKAVRDFNRTVPDGEKFLVRAIDANLDEYGGTDAFLDLFGWYANLLPDSGPIATFFSSPYDTPVRQSAAIESLREDLEVQRDELTLAWGTSAFETVSGIVEVEQASVPIRADRQDRYDASVRAREEVIKQLCDARIGVNPSGIIINIGGNHAQKTRFKGTDLEWLGDYLAHRSPAAGGSVFVLAVTAARIVSPDGSSTLYDLGASPPNELFRVMGETWPNRTVLLPLDDPLFTNESVLVNFEAEIYSTRLKLVYDAVLQYPLAHRDPGI